MKFFKWEIVDTCQGKPYGVQLYRSVTRWGVKRHIKTVNKSVPNEREYELIYRRIA